MTPLKVSLGVLIVTLVGCSDPDPIGDTGDSSSTGETDSSPDTGTSSSTGSTSTDSTTSSTSSTSTSSTSSSSSEGDDSTTTGEDSGTTSSSSTSSTTTDPGETGDETSTSAADGSTSDGDDSTGLDSSGPDTDPGGGSSSGDGTGGDSTGDIGSSGEESSGETGDEGPLNLVANPGFETNTTGWATWGAATLTRSTAQAHSGTSSGLVMNRTATWNGAVYSLFNIVEPGEAYDVSIWSRLNGTASAPARLTVQATCVGSAASYLTVDSGTLVDTAWTELAGTLVVPDCTLESINVYVDALEVGVGYYIDDLSVALRPPAENLIANPDFEVDAAGWFGFGSAAITASTDQFHEGAQSGYSTGRTATWQGPATDLLGILTPGESYAASAWVRLGGDASATTTLSLTSTCEGAAQAFATIQSATVDSTAWVRLGGALNVPDCTLTALTLYVQGPPADVDIYVDDVVVSE